jgi:hypothetical protein
MGTSRRLRGFHVGSEVGTVRKFRELLPCGSPNSVGPTQKSISHDRGVGVGFRYRFPRCSLLVPEQHECGVPPVNETEEHPGSDGPCGAH